MDGYLVQQPFADQIASGVKTWDVRAGPISLPRRSFYILATTYPHSMAPDYDPDRLGVAVGIARHVTTKGPFTVDELAQYEELHRIPMPVLREYARGRTLYAMVLEARPIDPRPYHRRQGAVHTLRDVEFL